MDELSLYRPRQWGACWLAVVLWNQLKLDEFWGPLLPPSREGTNWLNVLKTLTAYRLIDPGSEWRLHRLWFDRSATADLLAEDFGLKDLFDAKFEVLLCDLTSTYFECDARG